MSRYFVAVKRQFRSGDFSLDEVGKVPGIRFSRYGASSGVATVEASQRAISELKRRFGRKLIIEPEIEHHLV